MGHVILGHRLCKCYCMPSFCATQKVAIPYKCLLQRLFALVLQLNILTKELKERDAWQRG